MLIPHCTHAETLAALAGQLESLQAAFDRLGAENASAQQAAAAGQAAASQLAAEKEELAGQHSAVMAQRVRWRALLSGQHLGGWCPARLRGTRDTRL